MVATILSAQCTDVRVNLVTPALFRKYRTAADYARAKPGELEREIRQTGFFNSKARSLRRAGAAIAAEHGGRVPDTMEELLKLPGVGPQDRALAGAPLAGTADALRGRPPHRVVPVLRADQRVRDLVQDGVADLGLRMDGRQRRAQPNLLARPPADAGAALGPVEDQSPVVQSWCSSSRRRPIAAASFRSMERRLGTGTDSRPDAIRR